MYIVDPDMDSWGSKYLVDAAHVYCLPDLQCSICDSEWGTTGIEYPTVDVSHLSFAKRLSVTGIKPMQPSSLEEMRYFQEQLQPLVGADGIIEPGTCFGCVEGNTRGAVPDIPWQAAWTIMLSQNARDQLHSVGVRLSGVATTNVRSGKKKPAISANLFEVEVRATARLTPAVSALIGPPCVECGWREYPDPSPFPGAIVIDQESIPTNIDLFRTLELPTYIIATERFRSAVADLGLTGATFTEVRVA